MIRNKQKTTKQDKERHKGMKRRLDRTDKEKKNASSIKEKKKKMEKKRIWETAAKKT